MPAVTENNVTALKEPRTKSGPEVVSRVIKVEISRTIYIETKGVSSNPDIKSLLDNLNTEDRAFLNTFQFLEILEDLSAKSLNLKDRQKSRAYGAASTLVIQLKTSLIEYCASDKTDKDKALFKKNCLMFSNHAKVELDKHRKYPYVMGFLNALAQLASLIIAVCTLTKVPLLLGRSNLGLFPYFRTDSEQKLDKLEQAIKATM